MTTVLSDQVKAIVADPTKAPQVHDLMHAETGRVIDRMSDPSFDPGGAYSVEELVRRVDGYEAMTAQLATAAAFASYWGDPHDARLVPGVVSRLANGFEGHSGAGVWLELRRYPALLVFYVSGLAAVAGLREEALGPLFLTRGAVNVQQGFDALASVLYPGAVLSDRAAQALHPDNRVTPTSDRLHSATRPWLAALVADDWQFDRLFDRFEIILGLVVADLGRGDATEHVWGPIGRFAWRARYGGGMVQEVREELRMAGDSPLLRGGLFRGDPSRLRDTADAYFGLVNRVSPY